METLSGQSSFSREVREQDEGRYASGNLVLWVAVIAVLVGLNFASWSFCMWVFGQPEHPMNYALLTRLEKLEPIAGFTPVSAPRGQFHSVKDLYAQAYPFNAAELRAYNGILKRHYLKNYLERSDVAFVSGDFEVLSVRSLAAGDAFPSGFVVEARSTTFPDATLELVLPSPKPPPGLPLAPGQPLKVEESSTCAALVHVHRRADDTMVFTAVPLVSREFEFARGATLAVEPPGRIRLEPELWPLGGNPDSVERKPVSFSPEATEASEGPADPAKAGAAEAPRRKSRLRGVEAGLLFPRGHRGHRGVGRTGRSGEGGCCRGPLVGAPRTASDPHGFLGEAGPGHPHHVAAEYLADVVVAVAPLDEADGV